jgi:hypothetical protein
MKSSALLALRQQLGQLSILDLPQHDQPVPLFPAQSHNLFHLPSLAALKGDLSTLRTRGTSQIAPTLPSPLCRRKVERSSICAK